MGKSESQIQAELLKPFKASDVEWRLQWADKEKKQGLAVPFIDNRAIQARLDATVGIFGWRNEFTEWQGEGGSKKAQLCTLYIYSETRSEWIGKSDGADNSDIEPVKGGLSDSMKRAAVEWGIGRFLYEFTPQWVAAKPRGNGFVVDEKDRPNLDNYYNEMVAKLFSEGWFSAETEPLPAPTLDKTPAAPPPHPVSVRGKAPGNDPQPKEPQGPTPRRYTVMEHTVQDTMKGRQTHMRIRNDKGKIADVFLKGADPRLAVGCTLTDISLEKKGSNGLEYSDLTMYTIVDTPLQGVA